MQWGYRFVSGMLFLAAVIGMAFAALSTLCVSACGINWTGDHLTHRMSA